MTTAHEETISAGPAPAGVAALVEHLRRREPVSCPACGATAFEAVGIAGMIRLVCRSCQTCSEPGPQALVLSRRAD